MSRNAICFALFTLVPACAADPAQLEEVPADNGAFTLSRVGFVDDGIRVADAPVGEPAAIDADEWSIALPEGTIAGHDVRIVLREGDATLEQTFAYNPDLRGFEQR